MARVKGEVAGFFLYSITVAFLSGIIGIVTARILGPADRGALASVYTVATTILAVFLVSLPDALSFELRRDQVPHRGLVSAAVGLAALYSTLGGLAALFVISQLPAVNGLAVPALAAAFVVMSSLGTVSLSTFIGLADFRMTNRLRLVGPVALLMLLGSGALVSPSSIGVREVLLCYLASEVVAFTAIGLQISRRVGFGSTSRPLGARLARTGARLHPSTLLSIASANIDKFWIIAIASSHDIGIYVVAMTLASAIIGAVGSAVFTVWLPRLQAISVERRTESFIYLISIALVTLAVVASIGAATSPLLVHFLFGRDYAQATPIAALLFLGSLLLAMRQIAHRCIRAYEDFRTGGYAELSYLVAFVVLATILPIESHLYRVVSAFLLANLLAFGATLILASRTLGMSAGTVVVRIAGSIPAAFIDVSKRVAAFATRSRS